MKIFFYSTKIGRIGIGEDAGRITNVYLRTDSFPESAEIAETDLIREASRQLSEYLSGNLKIFKLPIAPQGTDFMQKIWHLLCEVPYGETATYKDIATAAGNPNAARAVGQANHRNPIPIIIPCHRIVGTGGKLGGYRSGLEVKQKLLDIERQAIAGQ